MPQSYIVTLKKDCSDDDVAKLKQEVKDKGGNITHEYNLIKGFAVEYPEGHVSALESHPHVENIEADQIVKTQ